ncbi:MAG TPA: DUF6612 family protein [Dehalococcoidales bacterium]|nr:DUF6612 family protein [Dehalococcoidales bacterium]
MRKVLAVFFMIVAVMALSIPFAACKVKLPSAEDVVNEVTKTMDSVETYEVNMDMRMDMTGEADGTPIEVNMTMAVNGVIDIVKSQMKIDMNMYMAGPEEEPMNIAIKMYIFDDMTYTMMDMPLMGPIWTKTDTEEKFWDEMSYAESQVDLLKGAQVEVIGIEVVDGKDCYVLQITPSMDQLWDLMMEQMIMSGEEIPDIPVENIKDMFRSFSVKQWIDKNTSFLTKADIATLMVITPEAVGEAEGEGEITMDITISMLAKNYNQPVSIVLPPEAEDAIYAPMLGID